MAGQGIHSEGTAVCLPVCKEEPLDDVQIAALAEYERAIDAVIDQKSGTLVSNGSPYHARIVLRKIFEKAQSDVVVYSGHLRCSGIDADSKRRALVWGDLSLIDAAKIFLQQPNRKLSILVEAGLDCVIEDGKVIHPFLNALFEDPERKSGVELVVGAQADLSKSTQKHFASADGRIYRLETAGDGVAANASFNAPTLAKILRAYFFSLVRRLDPVESGPDGQARRVSALPAQRTIFNLPTEFVTTA